ncbi:hypothetical protein X922_14760 [Pseudomonas aeruginosa VRFPA08]|nr:hypothetical protein X922_14760 [Pseudomonas aeruginosa VRFPA08]
MLLVAHPESAPATQKKMPPRINAVLLFIMGLLDQTKLRQAMPAAMRAVPDQRVTDATSPSRRAPTPKFPSSPIPAQAAEAALIGIRLSANHKSAPLAAMHVTATQRPTQRIGPPAVMARRPSG